MVGKDVKKLVAEKTEYITYVALHFGYSFGK